jgi:hypothetical protein
MATCDPNSILAKASCFSCLPPGLLRIVKIQLMREIVGGVQASPQTLLDRAACFSCLSPGILRVLKLQLWCEILGGGTGCVVPATPVFAFQSLGFSSANVTWTQAIDPSFDFLVQWGQVQGGPYPNTVSFGASQRSGNVALFGGGGPFNFWGVIQARNSISCVSANSNEINL